MPILPYVTVAEVRAEGVTAGMATDARIEQMVALAQAYFEAQTLMFFNLREAMSIRLDGTGSPVLELPAPAQVVTSVTVDGQTVTEVIDPSNPPSTGAFVNYNDREEDDYWFPRLEMYGGPLTRLERAFYYGSSNQPYTSNVRSTWPWGKKNVLVVGDFGFVEEDGSTPMLVKNAIIRLTIPRLTILSAVNPMDSMKMSESLGSYSYSLGGNAQNMWGFVNDPVVADIIGNYTRVSAMRSV